MNPAKRQTIFERFQAANPEPRGELEYRTPFELLIAVILSAQATDKSVNLATRSLYRVADTPAAMLALGVEGLIGHIKRIGLYRSKAKNVLATCALLLQRHDAFGRAVLREKPPGGEVDRLVGCLGRERHRDKQLEWRVVFEFGFRFGVGGAQAPENFSAFGGIHVSEPFALRARARASAAITVACLSGGGEAGISGKAGRACRFSGCRSDAG